MSHFLAFFSAQEEGPKGRDHEAAEFLSLVRSAKQEWQTAQNNFEHVCDPELVDIAIYKLETARRRYMYLLKQARIQGLEERQFLKAKTGATLS